MTPFFCIGIFRRIYVDSRLHQMQSIKFGEPFFQRGDFPPVVQNGSQSIVLENPWVDGTVAAPFDQCMYLLHLISLLTLLTFFVMSSILPHLGRGRRWH
jgi:hypothetical protein